MSRAIAFVGLALCVPAVGAVGPLFSNGPVVTDPTGGTGAIAGLPISRADSFVNPLTGSTTSTTGIASTVATGTACADNFVVPGGGWDLDSATFYAFQTGQSAASITEIRVNLWTQKPFAADSPDGPIPDPLPQPVLTSSLVLPAGVGTFVCHRQSHTSTSTSRPVFSYTVSLDGLPGQGRLGPGEYWLEWSFVGASSPSSNVFMPIAARAGSFDFGARLFNSVTGSSTGPRTWFEGREGFAAGIADGRAYALPFDLAGGSPDCVADVDDGSGSGVFDGGVTIDDLIYYLARFEGGC